MPVFGSSKSIKIIREAESVIAVRKVKVCWSSPFKMPSLILSRYINGTIGERAFSKKPTLWSLYISTPISWPATKKIAPQINPTNEVSLKTFSQVFFITDECFFATASEISGIKRVEIEFNKAAGKNSRGRAIPFIAPKRESESPFKFENFARFLGTNIFSAVRRKEFRYLPDVIGKEIRKICFNIGYGGRTLPESADNFRLSSKNNR